MVIHVGLIGLDSKEVTALRAIRNVERKREIVVKEEDIVHLDVEDGRYHIWSFTESGKVAYMRCGVMFDSGKPGVKYRNASWDKKICIECLKANNAL